MSEIKGQLLGMILVLSAFGVVLGILIPSFTDAANNVSKTISVDTNESVTNTASKANTQAIHPVIA